MFVNIRYILPGMLHDSILTLSSSLGAIVVLTLSSLNPLLRELVLDIDELQSIVLDNIRPWAFSSLEAVVTILEDMQKKRRLLSRV